MIHQVGRAGGPKEIGPVFLPLILQVSTGRHNGQVKRSSLIKRAPDRPLADGGHYGGLKRDRRLGADHFSVEVGDHHIVIAGISRFKRRDSQST